MNQNKKYKMMIVLSLIVGGIICSGISLLYLYVQKFANVVNDQEDIIQELQDIIRLRTTWLDVFHSARPELKSCPTLEHKWSILRFLNVRSRYFRNIQCIEQLQEMVMKSKKDVIIIRSLSLAVFIIITLSVSTASYFMVKRRRDTKVADGERVGIISANREEKVIPCEGSYEVEMGPNSLDGVTCSEVGDQVSNKFAESGQKSAREVCSETEDETASESPTGNEQKSTGEVCSQNEDEKASDSPTGNKQKSAGEVCSQNEDEIASDSPTTNGQKSDSEVCLKTEDETASDSPTKSEQSSADEFKPMVFVSQAFQDIFIDDQEPLMSLSTAHGVKAYFDLDISYIMVKGEHEKVQNFISAVNDVMHKASQEIVTVAVSIDGDFGMCILDVNKLNISMLCKYFKVKITYQNFKELDVTGKRECVNALILFLNKEIEAASQVGYTYTVSFSSVIYQSYYPRCKLLAEKIGVQVRQSPDETKLLVEGEDTLCKRYIHLVKLLKNSNPEDSLTIIKLPKGGMMIGSIHDGKRKILSEMHCVISFFVASELWLIGQSDRIQQFKEKWLQLYGNSHKEATPGLRIPLGDSDLPLINKLFTAQVQAIASKYKSTAEVRIDQKCITLQIADTNCDLVTEIIQFLENARESLSTDSK